MFYRTAYAALLLVAGVAIGGAQDQKPPFEDEIVRYEQEDAKNPPAEGAIVFVGSSSIRMWDSLAKDFPNHRVLNRGFGGSQISDSVRNVHRIVTPYKPKMIVMFAGTNDIASGKSAETVFADYKEFVARVRTKLPTTPIVYISISPAPSRWAKLPDVKRANGLIKEYADREPNLEYVDVFSPMLTESGGPRPELFIEDQLHMNPSGYAIWKKALTPILPKD